MGTSTSFAELADKCRRAAAELERAKTPAVNHGAFIFKKHLVTGIAAAVGSDMEYTEGGGIPVSVRYRLQGRGPVMVATIYPLGPVHFLRGTKPHRIPRTRKAVKFADGEVRREFDHPGSRGRLTWERDKQRAIGEAQQAMFGEYVAALRRVFPA